MWKLQDFYPAFPPTVLRRRIDVTESVSFPTFRIHQTAVDLIADPGAIPGRFLFGNPLAVPFVFTKIGRTFSRLRIIHSTANQNSHQEYHQRHPFHVPSSNRPHILTSPCPQPLSSYCLPNIPCFNVSRHFAVEPVEKPLSGLWRRFGGGFEVSFDPSLSRKIDCDAFYAITFFWISKSSFFRGFFYRLVSRSQVFRRCKSSIFNRTIF
jgi:hypothetical protein